MTSRYKKDNIMKKIKIEPNWGGTFDDAAKEAKAVSINKNCIAEFEFNGVVCLVNSQTNLKWLLRDYMNSWTMGWKEIGPTPVKKYSPKVEKEFKEKTEIREAEQKKKEEEWRKKDEEERNLFESKIMGVEIELSDKIRWDEFKEVNKDPYGACCVEYAEGWAKLMQVEFKNGRTIAECAEKTSHELGFLGITGFMYGCAVSMLAKCWKHGEALRLWHNLDTQISNEGEKANESGGVLNPALLNIG